MNDAIRRFIDRMLGRSELRNRVEYYEWLTEHNADEFVKTVARTSADNRKLREATVLGEEIMHQAIDLISEGYDDEAAELLQKHLNGEEVGE